MLVDDPQIFHRTECRPHDYGGLALVNADSITWDMASVIWQRLAYFVLNDKFLADILKITFTHALETVPNVLLDK